MKTVVGISLGSSAQDFDFITTFLGRRLHVRRIGTNGSTAKAVKLVRQWDGKAAAIGLGAVKDSHTLGARPVIARDTLRLRDAVTHSPVSTGARLGELFLEWAVRRTQIELGSFFNNANVLFFSGMAQYKLATTLAEYTDNLQFADPLLQMGIPKLLTSLDALTLFASGAHYLSDWEPPRVVPAAVMAQWSHFVLGKALQRAHVVVAPVHELDGFGLEELAGKTVVTSAVNDARLAAFRAKGVHTVIDGALVLRDHVVTPELLDAMILAATDKAPEELLDDDYLEIITSLQMRPRILYPNGFKRVNRFAFVIHPLSQKHFRNVQAVDLVSRVAPPIFLDSVEKVMAFSPPFVYSRVEGVKSPTGVEAEGWLITVGGTPREIMAHSPEFTYRRLLAAAAIARKLGAQIMGLGAFTKVVGDAGVTVARQAPLPITTGNSYSASAALWAAHDALLRLDLLPAPRGRERVDFKAMVVGATGAIGAACSRLLVRAAREVTLVSPETAKLLALKESILQDTPDAQVVLAAKADGRLAEMDMIVTATSGAGKRVLDIMKLKPGCVITDVALPMDISPEDAARRPDVLVIQSGEIQLPGTVRMKDIGLPKGVAYACLAETIVLALESRFENYTVGRNIQWEKVHEIYQLGLKHGMKLAAISGVNGVISDEDIAKVRAAALAARAQPPRRRVAAKTAAKPAARTRARRVAEPA